MTSWEYWKIRALQKEQRLKERGEKFLSELETLYQKTQKEIEKDLKSWYERYAEENGISPQAARRLLSQKELQRHLGELSDFVRKANLSPRYTRELNNRYIAQRISRLRGIEQKILLQLRALAQEKERRIHGYLRESYRESYYEGLHQLYFSPEGEVLMPKIEGAVRTGFVGLDARAVEEAVLAPWSGKNFSQRIWANTKKLERHLQEVLSLSIAQGHSIEKMTKRLQMRMKSSYSDTKRLVRTETNYVLSESTARLYEDVGLERYQFLATLDYKTSEVCQELDGKVFLLKDRQVGVNCHPMHPNCRSTTIPYFPRMQGERIARDSSGRNYHVDRHTNYKEWFDSLADSEKESMQIKRKMDHRRSRDRKEYEKYRVIFGKRVGNTLEEFQKMKYMTPEKWVQYKQEKQETLNRLPYREDFFGKFGNKEVRLWYKYRNERIPELLDPSKSLLEQAKEAVRLRNEYKHQARDMMRDQKERARLDAQEKPKSFEELLERKRLKYGLTEEEALLDIIRSSATTNKAYDRLAGLEERS